MPRALRHYFFAQLAYTVVTTPVLWRFGNTSKVYAICYGIFTAFILLAVIEIAWQSLWSREFRLRASAISLLLAVAITRVAYLGLGHPATLANWIVLGEAAILYWAGVVLGMAAVHVKSQDVTMCLSILWLTQSTFFYGWCLHNSELWDRLGYIIPTGLCVAAFTWLGWRLRTCQKIPQRPSAA
jgi:hypothetical protein